MFEGELPSELATMDSLAHL